MFGLDAILDVMSMMVELTTSIYIEAVSVSITPNKTAKRFNSYKNQMKIKLTKASAAVANSDNDLVDTAA